MRSLIFIVIASLFAMNSFALASPEIPPKVIQIPASEIVVYEIQLENGERQYIREIVMRNGDICRTVIDKKYVGKDVYTCGPNQDQRYVNLKQYPETKHQ